MKKCLKLVVMFFALLASRSIWLCIIAIKLLYDIYWTADQQLYSFKEQWQASAHVQLFGIMFGSISTIVLSYLGFTRKSTGLAGFVSQTFDQPEPTTSTHGLDADKD